MSNVDPGVYEQIITDLLAAELAHLDGDVLDSADLHPAEAADRIALHLARVIERSIETTSDRERVEIATVIARRVVELLDEAAPKGAAIPEAPQPPGRILRAVHGRNPDGSARPLDRPMIPLLDTTLLTNAPGEPRVGHQLHSEVESADQIDLVMAFIRSSGIAPLIEPLRQHCEAGKPLRVLTTTYTNSTEQAALERLARLGADVRVSYDLSGTRLHAKAWLFHRRTGFSTAYIGSSNLTHQAQQTGLEWNVRVSAARNRAVIEKVAAVFESYWSGGDFVKFTPEEFEEHTARATAAGGTVIYLPPTDIRLEPFQERLLDGIELSRAKGRHRNLLVAATGTGKTVMAAVDYARLRSRLPRARLLFVAHREELLDQSLATFRHAARDATLGLPVRGWS